MEKATSTAPIATKKRRRRSPPSAPSAPASDNNTSDSATNEELLLALRLLDPLLQFLTKATGHTTVPLVTLKATLPGGVHQHPNLLSKIEQLSRHDLLNLTKKTNADANNLNANSSDLDPSSSNLDLHWDDKEVRIGFPNPCTTNNSIPSDGNGNGKGLHGSTKTAAKRRLAALKRILKKQEHTKQSIKSSATSSASVVSPEIAANPSITDADTDIHISVVPVVSHVAVNTETKDAEKNWNFPSDQDASDLELELDPIFESEDERQAHQALQQFFQFQPKTTRKLHQIYTETNTIPSHICPQQASYAGSNPAQASSYQQLSESVLARIPMPLLDALDIDHPSNASRSSNKKRQLYTHQVKAIESALQNKHTLVCTGTGSGKSLGFLLPALQAAYSSGETSLILFPTKALAQDQLVKLLALVEASSDEDLQGKVIPATLDGDCSHSQRSLVAASANVIFTNPDTLHAAILPHWKGMYRPLLSKLRYIVIDEAHMYEGVFGAHVAMVLSRLYRVATLCRVKDNVPIAFLACSATMAHPDHHFRLLCPISKHDPITILTSQDDGSPRSAKHFFVWNPPLLDVNGISLGRVTLPKKRLGQANNKNTIGTKAEDHANYNMAPNKSDLLLGLVQLGADEQREKLSSLPSSSHDSSHQRMMIHRRHSADETALLLACAVTQGIRCIAFCKTRGLVEWVYERAMRALKSDPMTAPLVAKIESYRGGYSRLERRQIEEKLFQNQLLGVVGTSALELGVDIGGVDLTLHCGFPSSHASLLQQAGRAGRGKVQLDRASLAIVVCFNAPVDQHLWRHPKSLLSLGVSAPLSMPIYAGLVQGHLLCAGAEFPLTGDVSVATVQSVAPMDEESKKNLLSDNDLFGSREVYDEAFDTLLTTGSFVREQVATTSFTKPTCTVFRTHGSIDKPWTRVSLRSIEPVSYDIVDVSHPKQRGRMDGIHDSSAIMDTVPYSRIFYHAYPGAIIMHRGRRYKIEAMARPPAFANQLGTRRSMHLPAYATPSNHRYFTRPLSSLNITVVKQMERVDLVGDGFTTKVTAPEQDASFSTLPPAATPDVSTVGDESAMDLPAQSFAGCGVVTVKRNVHGYKKLSLVNREELSRSELSLPDMEYDSFAVWLDCEAELFAPLLGNEYGHGIHALSHAILAVAPLFVPCVPSDVQCDHSVFNPTRVTIFDARAGGSGICSQLWKHFFIPNGLVHAAIDLLESCASCNADPGYQGGCPACIQFGECIKFNDYLCKAKGLVIGKRLLERIQKTDLYRTNDCIDAETCTDNNVLVNEGKSLEEVQPSESSSPTATPVRSRKRDETEVSSSPRRSARATALRTAKNMASARDRQLVIGRPSWPMDRSDGPSRDQEIA
jgi:DEAD/DEAH box helicase domain-containing protein